MSSSALNEEAGAEVLDWKFAREGLDRHRIIVDLKHPLAPVVIVRRRTIRIAFLVFLVAFMQLLITLI